MVRWPRERGIWLVVGVLVALLALLAALQYQWTGEIGRAEAERQRARLERASQRLAAEFGRELGQAMMAFRPDMRVRGDADPHRSLLQRLETWKATERAGLVSRLTLISQSDAGATIAEVADPERLEFTEVPFPPQLESIRQQLEDPERTSPRGSFRPVGFLDDPPALLIPVIQPRAGDGLRRPFRPGALRMSGIAVLELSEDYLRGVLLPELAEVHFGPLDEGDYAVAVLRQHDDSVLYSSDPELSDEERSRPDVRLALPSWYRWPIPPRDRPGGGFPPDGPPPGGERSDLLAEREHPPDNMPPDPADRLAGPPNPPAPGGSARGGDGGPPPAGGPWVLIVRHRGGSLAEAVSAVRRRNLVVGFGVLALLGTAGVLLAVGAHRARNLARQQLEFVAGVTHELHTPLAAIRSAGQNLADGVVSSPEQTRRYGALIQKEGRRLGALVAQVLDFAGIESGSRAYSSEPVPLGPLVTRVVGDLGLILEQAGMQVDVDVPDDLPEIHGDAEALGRALENLLTNAVKFGADGSWVGVRAATGPSGRTVEIRVEDHGPGIPRAERKQVFEPFFRGHDARRSQAPGSGLGLSLVRHVVEAHGGRVHMEGGGQGGTEVVMELPSAEGPPEERT